MTITVITTDQFGINDPVDLPGYEDIIGGTTIVSAGVTISADYVLGLHTSFASIIVNMGYIDGGSYGVGIDGNNAQIVNQASGVIEGTSGAALISATGVAVKNYGTMITAVGNAVDLAGSADSFTNFSGGLVAGGSDVLSAGIAASGSGARVTNSGSIEGMSIGINLQGIAGQLTNRGEVTGGSVGVRIAGDQNTVVNSGHIEADSMNAVHIFGNGTAVFNSGSIFGQFGGIEDDASAGTTTIINSGLLDSHGFTLFVGNASGAQTSIYNTGTIESDSSAIAGGSAQGKILLNNGGSIVGNVYLTAQADKVVNTGHIAGDVFLQDGNDSFNGRGGHVDGIINGLVGNDRIVAGEGDTAQGDVGNDTLVGRGSFDNLDGGKGADILKGGLGADTFVYDSLSDSTVAPAGEDIIFNFSHAQGDQLDLSAIDAVTTSSGDQEFHFVSNSAQPSSAAFSHSAGELRFALDGTSTVVQGDVNGDGKADFQITLAHFQPATLLWSDFVL